jgi:hypothetical protein
MLKKISQNVHDCLLNELEEPLQELAKTHLRELILTLNQAVSVNISADRVAFEISFYDEDLNEDVTVLSFDPIAELTEFAEDLGGGGLIDGSASEALKWADQLEMTALKLRRAAEKFPDEK